MTGDRTSARQDSQDGTLGSEGTVVGRVVSLNVGQPQDVEWQGKTIHTSIVKMPVDGTRRLTHLRVEGDAQADLSVHGGTEKAVYAFASENYSTWKSRFPEANPSWGFFGENLTTEGLPDDAIRIGNRYRIGSAEVTVTMPRLPCSRLAWRFRDTAIIQDFLQHQHTGTYLSVQTEGEVGAGDSITLLFENADGFTIPESVALYSGHQSDADVLQRASQDPSLPDSWRQRFAKRLQGADD